MFGIFKKKKQQKYLYKITYCLSAMVDNEKHTVTFDTSWLRDLYVAAYDMADAQVEFAKRVVLSPHIYVHRIEKMGMTAGIE